MAHGLSSPKFHYFIAFTTDKTYLNNYVSVAACQWQLSSWVDGNNMGMQTGTTVGGSGNYTFRVIYAK